MSKLIIILSKAFNKYFWKKPKVYKILFIDKAGSDDLFNSGIIKQHETYIVDLDNFSWLNIHVLANAFLKRPRLLFENKFSFIMASYIDYVKPKYVITWMDYITSFYRLKNYIKEPIYISLQSGRRSIEPGQFFHELQSNQYKNLNCDYIFCYGDVHAKEYRKHIKCTAIPSGSIRNNIVPLGSKDMEKREVLFLSQYRSRRHDPFIKYDSNPVSWDIFFKVEKILLPLLAEYCKKKSLKLNIVSAIASAEQEEEEFYDSLVGNYNYNFIKHHDGSTGYKAVDMFKFIVGVNSTLLYEALARNKRTVFFDARGSYCGIPHDTFGWPMLLKEKGEFWTNEINQNEFSRLMNFLINFADDEWLKSSDKITPYLINFDNDNTMLRGVFD